MATNPNPKVSIPPPAEAPRDPVRQVADRAERDVAQLATWALPLITVAGALVIGVVASPGPAFLVLVGGGLLGVIALVWASLRTLTGDAPLVAGLAEAMASRRLHGRDLAERKRRALRALKDLEHERSVGKIDEGDYAELAAKLRDEAKAVLRELDESVEILRPKAEALVAEHLRKRGLTPPTETAPDAGATKGKEASGDGST